MTNPQVTRALLEIVREDLSHLTSSWGTGGLTDASLRRESLILRRLLVEGDLLRVWVSIVGREDFRVPARNLSPDSFGLPFASSSVVKNPGMTLSSVQFMKGKPTLEDFKTFVAKMQSENALDPRPIRFKQFIEGVGLVVERVPVKRRELIQFVANKIGGAHYDSDRLKPSERVLTVLHGQLGLGGRDAVFHELLGMGQAVARSDDTRRLLQRLEAEV